MVYIFYCKIAQDQHELLLKTFLPQFSIAFQEKIMKYRRWQDAQLSLLGRVLLKKGLNQLGKQYDESKLKVTAYNKPYFENDDLEFNISHSGEIVVCAISKNGAIGIDIEECKNIDVHDFKSQMTCNEWNTINQSKDIVRAFYKYWTEKEAVIKAHGNGLSIPLKSFEVNNAHTKIVHEDFWLKKIDIESNYYCTISFKERDIEINEIEEKLFL